MKNPSITAVRGVAVGHAQDNMALTGCTVVLCRNGAVAGVDVRGGAPGTRETDLLQPINLVQKVHAVLLAGGSAFGLDAAGGVMQYLEEQNIGFATGAGPIPIVPAAILFDLDVGERGVRPDGAMGYEAVRAASARPVAEGNVGVGTGATVGKILGLARAMKTGLGTAVIELGRGVRVGALAAVNAFGDVVDPGTSQIIAGVRSRNAGPMKGDTPGGFANTLELMRSSLGRAVYASAIRLNTVLGVIAVNASMTKADMTKIAQMAQDGIARTIRPAHTLLDGDVVFALATGGRRADVSTVGAFAAEVLSAAILRAVRVSASAGGVPGFLQ